MGDFGRDGRGDLYIEINELKDGVLQRDGDNIIANVNVPFYTAILGGEIGVPTLDGERGIEIPQGTAHGTRVVVRGAGIKRLNSSSKGDEIVIINIGIPKTLSANERKLMEDFRDINSGKGSGQNQKKFGLF
jgi:molecular chaperone DnaJ